MKVDGGIPAAGIDEVVRVAKELEAVGYDGGLSAETNHDPFFPLLVAAEHTESLELGTGIAVAFARSPMTLANIGYDLQAYSKGRFRLGLGSQIKPHIEKRFSMPWSHPAARMRELILAVRAIWDCWNHGTKLDFRGEFYRHTLMTPFFDPGPNPNGAPTIQLAAVGELMTEVAGEVADGVILHAFTTERYVQEVTLPALERGFAKSGKTRGDFEISGPMFVVSGTNDEELDRSMRGTREQIAFYGSTPAYRGVLELHGWGDLQDDLNRLSKRGEWQAMGDLITEDVLDAFAVVAAPEEIPAAMLARYDGIVDRLQFYAPYRSDPERWQQVLAGFGAVNELEPNQAEPTQLEMVVEIPKGSRNKYEVDHATGDLWLDRTLFTATQYPADYGFVPDTLAEDGDPLDVLVLLDEPTFPGCHVMVRPIGVFRMRDEAGGDDKVLAVPAKDPRYAGLRDLGDVRTFLPFLLDEIEHFFAVYKEVEPGKDTEPGHWEDAAAAVRIVAESRARFA